MVLVSIHQAGGVFGAWELERDVFLRLNLTWIGLRRMRRLLRFKRHDPVRLSDYVVADPSIPLNSALIRSPTEEGCSWWTCTLPDESSGEN